MTREQQVNTEGMPMCAGAWSPCIVRRGGLWAEGRGWGVRVLRCADYPGGWRLCAASSSNPHGGQP